MSGPKRVIWFVVVLAVVAALTFLFSGCALTKGRIKGHGVTVQGQKDGNNASLAQEHSTGVLTLPAGSTVTVTKFGAVPWEPAINGRPEVRAQPAREVTEVKLSRDTTWQKDEAKVDANTGTIDTTVAVRRIQAAENRLLLYASMGCAVMSGVFFYIKYPTPAIMCGAASVVAFIAWKLADLPHWFWVLAPCLVFGAIMLWRGYERRENEEKARKEELAKAKALAVPAAPPVPVVVTNPPPASP